MNKKLIIIMLCMSLGFIACNNSVASSSSSSLAPDNWVGLGEGVYSPSGLPATTICMQNVKPSFSAANYVPLFRVPQATLQQYLGFSIDHKGGWQVFSTGSTARFVADSQDDAYSRNFTYLQDFSWGASFEPRFGMDNLSSAGQAAYKAGISQFLGFCGDSYVSGAHAGVLLAVNLKILFKSHQDQQVFDQAFNNGLPTEGLELGAIIPAISKSHFSKNLNLALQINLQQLGGMPDKLSSVLTKDLAGNYYGATCNFSNFSSILDACGQVINGIMQYALLLPTQVRDAAGNMLPENLSYYNPSISNYSAIGIPNVETPSMPALELVAAQAQLQTLYQNTLADLTFVTHSLNSAAAPSFDLGMSTFLKKTQSSLDFRISLLNSRGFSCYTSKEISNCSKTIASIQSSFANDPSLQVDQTRLDSLKNQWAAN